MLSIVKQPCTPSTMQYLRSLMGNKTYLYDIVFIIISKNLLAFDFNVSVMLFMELALRRN